MRLFDPSRDCQLAWLPEQIQQGLTGRDWPGEAVAAKSGFGWNAEGLADRGAQVLHAHGAIFYIRADAIGFTVDRAAADTAAGKNGGPAVGPMLPTGHSVWLVDAGRATELTHNYD
jgi:hypothetical protein